MGQRFPILSRIRARPNRIRGIAVNPLSKDHAAGEHSAFVGDIAPAISPISLERARNVDHPALVRAVAEILAGPPGASDFSSFTSHSSSVAD